MAIKVLKVKVWCLQGSEEGEGSKQRYTKSPAHSLEIHDLHLEEGNVIVSSAEEDASSPSSRDEINVINDSDAPQCDEE